MIVFFLQCHQLELRRTSTRNPFGLISAHSGEHMTTVATKQTKETNTSMVWVAFAIGAAISWGIYGVSLQRGGMLLGNPMRALLCVGMAYFLIGVLAPIGILLAQGNLNGFNSGGTITATIAGGLGAIGAICIIFAFKAGGSPTYVMPLVFGGAPLINVILSIWSNPPKSPPNPLLYVGFLLVVIGAGMVLYFKPHS